MFIHITRTCGLFLSFWPAIDQVDVKDGVTVPWYRHGVGTTEVDMIKIAWYHAQLISGWEGSHTLHACLWCRAVGQLSVFDITLKTTS